MRNYTYHILVAILFFTGVASIQAQTLNDPVVSWGQSVTCIPVNVDGYWHAVNGTQVTVTLSASSPQNIDTKKYTGKINYKRGTTELSGNTDFFTPTNNEERSYAASFEYEIYTLNTLTGQYESTGQYGFDDSPSKSVKFKTYTQPDISDLEVTSPIKYTYKTANSVQFTATYNYNPGSNGLSYKIEWKKNSTLVASDTTNSYELSTDDPGDFTIEVTLTVYAPDTHTPWAIKTASKTITVYNKPTVQSLTPEKKYALTDYQPFNVTIALGDNLHSDIQKRVYWYVNGQPTTDTDNNLQTLFNPSTVAKTYEVSAKIEFYVKDGNTDVTLLTLDKNNENKLKTNITVYNRPTVQSLTPEKKYALTDDQSFNVTIALGNNLHSDIQKRVYWYVNEQPTTDTDNNLQTLFAPSTGANTYEVSAKIEFYVKDGNMDVTLLTLDKNNENKLTTNIMVYNRPTVQSFTPEKEYALTDDQSFNLTIALGNNLHSDIQKRVYWYVNGQPTTDTDNNLQTSFAPSTGANTYEVSAKIEFYVKDGNTDVTLLTLDKTKENKLKTNIKVYNVPTFTEISSKSYALVNDEISVEAKISNKHNDIKTNITWEGDVVGNSDKLTSTLIPTTADDYTVSAKITFLAPDNQTQLITLPREGENPITKTITVYDRPTVNEVNFTDEENNAVEYAYANNKIKVKVDAQYDNRIKPVVSWSSDPLGASVVKAEGDDNLTATYTVPSYVGNDYDQTIIANVTFNDPTGNPLTSDTKDKSIKVRKVLLNPTKKATYVGDLDFSINVVGYTLPSTNYTSYYIKWYINDTYVPDMGNELSASLILPNFDDDSKQITVKAEIIPYYGTIPVPALKQEPSTTFTVYKTPAITDNSVTLDTDGKLTSTCVGHSRTLTANFDYTPQSLPFKIEWYKGDTKVATGELNDSSYVYTPSSVENPDFSAKVLVCDPDGNETWTEASTVSPVAITVYQKPEDAVTDDVLRGEITENVGDYEGKPEMLVGHDGETAHVFTYEVKDLDDTYYWTYTWQLLDEDKNPIDRDGLSPQNNQKPKFNFKDLGEGTYYVKLTAKAYNKDNPYVDDNNPGEYWGKQEVTLDDHPITIYPAPQYVPLGNHIEPSDNTDNPYKYSILTNETFDVNKLFSYLDEEGKETGYPGGWHNKLTVKKSNDTLKESQDLTFTPAEKGEYTLTLNVTNTAPTGVWFDNKKDFNNNNDVVYTLYVYDDPEWNTEETEKLFATPVDGKYIRHIESGDEIPFEITGLNGDQNSDWDVTMTIDDGNPDSFTSNKSNSSTTFTHTFKEDNPNETEIIRDFHIQGTNNIQYLTKGTTPTTLDLQGTIHVWKNITATVDDGFARDNDGYYLLETRVGDDDKQELKIKLIGGDSDPSHDKWQINDPNLSTGTPIGTTENPKWDKDNRIYTYTVQDDAFTEAGEYTYTFEPKYIDGATNLVKNTDISPITFKVKVYPQPQIDQYLALSNPSNDPKKNVSYTEQSGKYVLICYNSDKLKMTVDSSGGKTGEVWKYQLGTGSKTIIPSEGITIGGEGTKKITFYNYLGEKEKEVKSIEAQITRKTDPQIETILPTVDNTTDAIWNAATAQNNAVDLYGGVLPDEKSRHVAAFDFSPKSSNKGNENGWNYSWKVNDKVDASWESPTLGKGNYTATTSTDNTSDLKKLSVNIKNSIPTGNGQVGENVGMDETKTYYVRVWHQAILPLDYSLTDASNSSNNIKETHAIREGNKLVAEVAPIEYGYSDNYHYDWTGQGEQDDKTTWENEKMTNTDNGDGAGSSSTTYSLYVCNYGPRNSIWAEKTYDPCKVHIYNRPETPTSLVMKGKGNSGTMIITYTDIMSDGELESRDDYVITFCYTDKDGNLQKIYKPQGGKGEVRWATGFPTDASQMSNVYAYAEWHYVNPETEQNVLITSGKRALENAEPDLNWDESIYNFSDETMQAIRAITRAGSGDYTDIQSIESDELAEGEISVYNMNGMMVGTSTKSLTPGIYIIRYKQDGMMKSKKLSVK